MTAPVTMVAEVAEPGWQFWNYSFQIVRDHIYVVVNYSHDDGIDRGLAVAKMRASMRNLVNWLLLSQSIMTSATIELESDEVMVRYQSDEAWVAHIPPRDELSQTPPMGSTAAIRLGVSWLGFLLEDRQLLYAVQDFASAVRYRDFALFFLYRSVEWIAWEYDEREDFRDKPDFALAAKALGLPTEWIVQIGRLAHAYTRHAHLREAPESHLIDATINRVRRLILRYIEVKHGNVKADSIEPAEDHLTKWAPPKIK